MTKRPIATRTDGDAMSVESSVREDTFASEQEELVVGLVTPDEFATMRDEWDKLLQNSRADTIFLTWEWLYTWWETYNTGKKLSIISVRDRSARLLGLFPFYVRERRYLRALRVRELRFLGSPPISSDYMNFIIETGHEEQVAAAGLSYLWKQSPDWDIAVLQGVSESSVCRAILNKFAVTRNSTYHEEFLDVCPYIPLPGSFDAFLASLGKKKRRNVRYYKRRLHDRHTVETLCVSEIGDVEAGLETLFSLHERRWKSTGLPGNFARSGVKDFHRALAKRMLACGWLSLQILEANSTAVAAYYDFQYGGKVFNFQSGFDPMWSKHSVAVVLRSHCVRAAIDAGLREYDMLRGSDEYKYEWTDKERSLYTLFVAVGMRNRALIAAFRCYRYLRSLIKRVLPRRLYELLLRRKIVRYARRDKF